MGLHPFVLFAAIFLLTYVGSTSKATAANSTAQVPWDAEEQNEASTQRRVRTSEAAGEGDEARASGRLINPSNAWTTRHESTLGEKLFGDIERLSYPTKEKAQNSGNALMKYDFEAILARRFYAASQSKFRIVKGVGKALVEAQFREWLWLDRSADDVFVMIMKGKRDSEVFADRNWKLLEHFVQVYNERKGPVALVDVIVEGFGDEARLLKALIEGKQNFETRDNAKQLEKLLLTKWVNDKVQLGTVLHWLEMDQNVDAIASPAIEVAVLYVDHLNENNPPQVLSLVAALTEIYGDTAVAQKLLEILTAVRVIKYSQRLRFEQLDNWFGRRESVKKVFEMLNIAPEDGRTTRTNKFISLIRYANAVENGHRNPSKTSSGVLETSPSMSETSSSVFETSPNGLEALLKLLRAKYEDDVVFAMMTAELSTVKLPNVKSHLEHAEVLHDVFQRWLSLYTPQELSKVLEKSKLNYPSDVKFVLDEYTRYHNDHSQLAKRTQGALRVGPTTAEGQS